MTVVYTNSLKLVSATSTGNLNTHMPLISSGGVRQTPWSEGMNVRHLEPMGFIKFDILGLASLRMIEGAIRHILIRVHGMKDPTFEDVKEYYNKNLHPDNIDFSDEKVWKKDITSHEEEAAIRADLQEIANEWGLHAHGAVSLIRDTLKPV